MTKMKKNEEIKIELGDFDNWVNVIPLELEDKGGYSCGVKVRFCNSGKEGVIYSTRDEIDFDSFKK